MICYMSCSCFTKFLTLSLDQFLGVQVWFESLPGHQIKAYPNTYGSLCQRSFELRDKP